jgi:CRISPR system Cascade subunit CasB
MPDTSAPSTAARDADAPDSAERPDLATAVGRAAGMLSPENGSISNGDRAALRRINTDAPVTPALWKVLHHLGIPDPDPQYDTSEAHHERNWGLLLMGMAHCAGLHDYKVPLGKALALAGWSELRFTRLMEADDETLPALMRRMAQYLASKQQPANWADVAYLLFTRDSEKMEATRLDIARAYYSTLYQQEQDDS